MVKFKVVELGKLLDMPSPWQWPEQWKDEFREKLEIALNEMAKEGWIYMDQLTQHGITFSQSMLVFRREP